MISLRLSLPALPALGLILLAAALSAPGAGAGGEAASLPPDYWTYPLAAQGEAPADWDEAERSLAPQDCGECHQDQYLDWRTSLHAQAFSPGLVGQLVTSFSGDPGSCMRCHAPLAEQIAAFQAALAKGQGHLRQAQGLAAAGNSCAGCHLRRHRRYGPPQRESGETGRSDPEAPHGGVTRTADFEKSEFCSACHQFPPSWGAVNGKPLENTFAEWKASPQAEKGITCQACHMPGRRHLWRGIHDPETVEAGLTARFEAEAGKARFILVNSGVGHAFPTYITPKVTMHAVALDGDGKPMADTKATHVIRRSVASTPLGWVENFDTRLLPGQSAVLDLAWGDGGRVRMWLEVHPDDFYDNVTYDGILGGLPAGSPGHRLIAEADAKAGASHYRLFETELERPD